MRITTLLSIALASSCAALGSAERTPDEIDAKCTTFAKGDARLLVACLRHEYREQNGSLRHQVAEAQAICR